MPRLRIHAAILPLPICHHKYTGIALPSPLLSIMWLSENTVYHVRVILGTRWHSLCKTDQFTSHWLPPYNSTALILLSFHSVCGTVLHDAFRLSACQCTVSCTLLLPSVVAVLTAALFPDTHSLPLHLGYHTANKKIQCEFKHSNLCTHKAGTIESLNTISIRRTEPENLMKTQWHNSWTFKESQGPLLENKFLCQKT